MYIKTLLATLFLVHAVMGALRCYDCDSTKGHANCQSGSGVTDEDMCPYPPKGGSRICLEYSENVNGSMKYVRQCDVAQGKSPCPSMKQTRKIIQCRDCTTHYCNKNPL
ncbi:hypothetical protein PPYR_07534 [Photinus pyralis]|uniref:Protein sleepless n=1 Tax=Photinus pyralis TaxID=7054 RepID=A0A5N4A3N5_PHOPY|nr:hypothetical protein PPYR_03712 [Photinus pyralis]KAB0799654.1 hypothetical protein PPYR_07534 [Photinus pyralis]